jgi:putative hydrolase of the HAD superfamily
MTVPEPLGLILDWGGVLTAPMDGTFTVFVEREGIDPANFQAVMRRMHDEPGSALHRVEVGALTREGFEVELASLFRTVQSGPVAAGNLLHRMFGHARVNEPMRSLARSARDRGWRTALLSNSWGNSYDEADLSELLGVVLLSERIGVRKPDPAAYLIASEEIGVIPSRCVFVDDLRRNALAADAVGMTGFQYRPGTEDALESILRARESA